MNAVTFTIPSSVEALEAMLGDLGQMAVATEFSRSALVAARVRGPDEPEDGRLTPTEFVKLRIVGLRSISAVNQYRLVWKRLNEAGLVEPAVLGATVTLPNVEWQEWAEEPDATADWRVGGKEMANAYEAEAKALGTTKGMAIRVGQSKSGLAAAILADPAVAVAAREALAERDRRHKPVTDPGPPPDEFTSLVITLRAVRRSLHDSLGKAMHIGRSRHKREVVGEVAGDVQRLAGAIVLMAQGEPIDDELVRLLEEGVL